MYYKSKVWGPFGWYFLHSISYYSLFNQLNPKEIEGVKLLIISLTNLIPCPECRKHFNQKFKKINIDNLINNPNYLINWIIDIHNEVNKSNKKPTYSRNQVDKLYTLSNRQIINQHQIIKFIDLLIKGAKFLPTKQRETGFKQLFSGLCNFYPEINISNQIETYFLKNQINFNKLSNIEKNWDIINQIILKKLINRDNNLCFEVKLQHLKSNLSDVFYFKPNICGITTLQKWQNNNQKIQLLCKNYDNSTKEISFDINPDFKVLDIRSIDYLNLTIDIRLGKKKNNVINF